jgi:hypothetical protein
VKSRYFLIAVLVCLLAIFSLGVIANEWCYQEQANESVPCGGVASGSYSYDGNIAYSPNTPAYLGYDANWNTCVRSQEETHDDANLYMNYTKPENATINATNNSLWLILLNGVPTNVSIPTACWNQPQLQFKGVANLYVGSSEYCWNGTDWQLVSQSGNLAHAFCEEGMWWDLGCVPDWSCSGLGECLPNNTQLCNATTDNNQCGVAYGGNYSEFGSQECDFCVPNWECDGYSSECVGGHFLCNATLDLNSCGEPYTGNYSEFQGDACEEQQITGYVAQYGVGDVPKLTIDLVGKTAVEGIGMMGLLILVLVIILVATMLKKARLK